MLLSKTSVCDGCTGIRDTSRARVSGDIAPPPPAPGTQQGAQSLRAAAPEFHLSGFEIGHSVCLRPAPSP